VTVPSADASPGFPHQPQQGSRVPFRERAPSVQAILAHKAGGLDRRAVLVGVLELALDKRRETALQQLQPFADALVVGDRRSCLSLLCDQRPELR
jgi:hypothetical protein